MLSRDEEMLAKHIREAAPGLLGGVLCGELHSLLRAERERWGQEMKAQQRDHRTAVQSARAEGFSAARKKAEARILKRCCAAMREHGHCEHQPCDYYQNALTEIRAMTDEGGES